MIGPDPKSRAPWVDAACRIAKGEPAQWIKDAKASSFIHSGGNVLHQHLLAELSGKTFSKEADPLESTRDLRESWEERRDSNRELVANWDIEAYLVNAKALNKGIIAPAPFRSGNARSGRKSRKSSAHTRSGYAVGDIGFVPTVTILGDE